MNGDPVTPLSEEKLTPEIKAKWVEALRSGKYMQAREVLHQIEHGCEKFCCLGVLQQLTDIPKQEDAELLDDASARKVGLSARMQERLSTLNDDGYDFGQIADLIEELL